MNCPNCNHPITCGCQKKKASDGKEVCSNCLALYEQELKTLQTNTPPPNQE